MANWYGVARTNYVHITDIEALKKELEVADIKVYGGKKEGTYAFFPSDSEDGDFPTSYWKEGKGADDPGEDVDFFLEDIVMKYVPENEVFVIQGSGAEKQRYVTGYSSAFIKQDGEVHSLHINLDDIYATAKNEWGVKEIANACY
jgi:hypothetical protein